ncbi:hypothetical protein [Streptomyces scopuliridis]|uniref:hypothetical protein n=1 Tax=Streptomyces scopuliridis TaxID=452529 RepID=UPI0036A44F5D
MSCARRPANSKAAVSPAFNNNGPRTGQIAGFVLVDLRRDDARIPALGQLGLPAVAVAHPSLTGPFAALWTDDGTRSVDRRLQAVRPRRGRQSALARRDPHQGDLGLSR